MAEAEEQHTEMLPHDVEKLEEKKLKARYPMGVTGRSISGHSALLQKRLVKGQKYFDSGDYQMAKQSKGGFNKQPLKVSVPMNPYATGDEIPTPESVPARKTSNIQQTKFNPNVGYCGHSESEDRL